MKLLTLNTWGGTIRDPLLAFLSAHKDVDIFCLQEIHAHPSTRYEYNHTPEPHLLDKIKEALPDYTCYFSPHLEDWFGMAVFVKNTLPIGRKDEHFIFHERGYIPESDFRINAKLAQAVELMSDDSKFTVFNVHGAWQPEGKIDTPDRLKQTDRMLEFAQIFGLPDIICGDFNALPDTESILKIERAGYRNLIKEYNIQSTRTASYTKPDKFADYIFVRQEVRVIDFKVLPDEISDHSPLLLEFDI